MIINIKKYFVQNKFTVAIFLIMIIAIFLRFYNYQNRFGLAYDQAHDAVVAHYALQEKLIPLVGPFSSAGPFQTGGEWYWFIMVGNLLIPQVVASPWIFLTLVYVLFVYLIIKVGEKLIDKTFGLIAGALAAVSTAQIAQSTNLTNQGPEAIVALVAIWAAISYIREKKPLYLFLLGFFVSFGISIHLQAVALGTLILFTILFTGVPQLRSIAALVLGLFIPFVPILIFDIQNDFVNSRNMLQYFLHDQYKIPLEALGRRWLTYAGVFWPAAWGHIIGGSTILGYVNMAGVIFVGIYTAISKKIDKTMLFLIVSFIVMFVILRYIRTPLYDSYLVFLNPFVILLTGWAIYFIYKQRAIVGLIIFGVIVIGSLYKDFGEIRNSGNLVTRMMIERWRNALAKDYPSDKLAFYNYKFKSQDVSLPLVLYMYYDRKIDNHGRKIGVGILSDKEAVSYKVAFEEKGGIQLFDLNSSDSAGLEKSGWFNINPSYIYNSTENWRKLSGK